MIVPAIREHLAAAAGHVRVCRALRDKGADHEVNNTQAQTALDLANANRHAAVRHVCGPTLSDEEFTEGACRATARVARSRRARARRMHVAACPLAAAQWLAARARTAKTACPRERPRTPARCLHAKRPAPFIFEEINGIEFGNPVMMERQKWAINMAKDRSLLPADALGVGISSSHPNDNNGFTWQGNAALIAQDDALRAAVAWLVLNNNRAIMSAMVKKITSIPYHGKKLYLDELVEYPCCHPSICNSSHQVALLYQQKKIPEASRKIPVQKKNVAGYLVGPDGSIPDTFGGKQSPMFGAWVEILSNNKDIGC